MGRDAHVFQRQTGADTGVHGAGGAPHAAKVLPRGQELAAVPGPPGAPHHAAAPPQGAGHRLGVRKSENASNPGNGLPDPSK